MNELWRLFGYPSGSAGALLDGTLPSRYCTSRIPTWRLPVPGHAASLVITGGEVPATLGIEASSCRVLRFSGSGMVKKRIRLNRKTPAHLAGYMIHSRPRVWKRSSHVDLSDVSDSDHKRRRCEQNDGCCIPFHGCAGPCL